MARDRGLSYLIKQVELGVRRPILDIAQEYGLNHAQYTALGVLKRRPGLISSELARRSFVRSQTMAETINALVDGGLIRKEQNPDHGRQIMLFITDEGSRRLDAVSGEVRDFEDDILRDFSDEEVEQFLAFLRRCREPLRSQPE
jgi:DNA-binding MarR family transcriptional regulator